MINKVTLIGHLGGDPDVKQLENGVKVARFSLATNEVYKDKDGNFQETTEWHNVVVWRELAERAEKMLKKGKLVYVDGKISYRKVPAQDGGQERYYTDIVANTFRLLEKREGGSGVLESRFPGAENAPAPRGGEMPSVVAAETIAAGGDDLPF
jgi:single-strand DNA-binding protein